MSEVEIAQTGAQVAPAETAQQEQPQEQAQVSTTEQVEVQERTEQPRDEKGRYVPQERVNEITRARRQAERELEAERRRAQELESQLSQFRQQRQPAAQVEAMPSPADFNYDMDAWGRAMTEQVTRRAEQIAEERLRSHQTQTQQQQAAQAFSERVRAYSVQHPDLPDKLNELDSAVQFKPEVVEALVSSEHGPAIAHYLADHLDEADRISRLPPHLAAVQLGRIEALVTAPKAKPVTAAPPPAPTVSGGSAHRNGIRPGMSYEQYVAARNGG